MRHVSNVLKKARPCLNAVWIYLKTSVPCLVLVGDTTPTWEKFWWLCTGQGNKAKERNLNGKQKQICCFDFGFMVGFIVSKEEVKQNVTGSEGQKVTSGMQATMLQAEAHACHHNYQSPRGLMLSPQAHPKSACRYILHRCLFFLHVFGTQ